jgi:hypothetical protein
MVGILQRENRREVFVIAGMPMCAELQGDGTIALDSTAALIRRMCGGDESAGHTLPKRFLGLLLRWAHGRLPITLRDVNDTEDFVQIALIKALNQMDTFRSDRPGSSLI